MDLSKLPKLSKTGEAQPEPDAGEAAEANPPPAPVPYARRPEPLPAVGLAEAWISIGLGLLLLFIFPNTIRYLHSPASFEQDNSFTDEQGNTISYPKSAFFWTDLGVTVFAAALMIEGVILAAARKIRPLLFAFAVSLLAAIFNVIVIAHAYPHIGFPIFCGVGVIVLVYMAMTQWRLIVILRQ